MKRQLLKMATTLVNSRGGHRSAGRRSSVWRKTVALWLSLTLVLAPLLGGRIAITPPAQAQVLSCFGASRIFQGCPLGGPFEVGLENQVLDDLLNLHQLPAGDRSRLLGWQRNEMRALLYDKLKVVIEKAEGARTTEEKAALTALATRIKQRRVQAAQFALDEYNIWKSSPCTYTPPEGFSYAGVQQCAAARLNPNIGGSIDPPSFEEFQAYGVARTYQVFRDLSTQRVMKQVVTSVTFFGGLYVGAVTGAVVALKLSSKVIQKLFPFGARALTGARVVGTAVVKVVTNAVRFARVITIGVPVLIIVSALIEIGLRGYEVGTIVAIPGKLQAQLDEAQSAPLPDLAQLMTTDSGEAEVFGVFILMTLPDFPATDPLPAAQDSDPQFRVQQQGAAAATTVASINFKSWEDDNQSARLNGGWYINKYREDNLDKERWELKIEYINWQGEAWTAGRAGAGFLHTKYDDPEQSFKSAEIKYKDWNGNNFTASLLLRALEIEALPVVLDRGHQEPGINVIAPQTLPIALVNSEGQAPNTLAVTVNNAESAAVTGVTITDLRVDSQGRVTASLKAECTASAPTFTLKVTDNAGQTKAAPLTIQLSPLASRPVNPLAGALPAGKVGEPYNGFLSAFDIFAGFCTNVSSLGYTVTSGKLPPGLSFGTSVFDSDRLIGTPATGGTYEFTVRKSYSNGDNFSRNYIVNIDSAPAPLPDGALSWWSGESGVADDLKVYQGRAAGGFNRDNIMFGHVGLAFGFNGGSGAVQLPDNFFPFPPAGDPQFTFETWFKTGSGGVIFGRQDTEPWGPLPTHYAPGLYVGTDGRLRAQMFWSGTINPVTSQTIVTDGYFHHVAVSYDRTEQIVYLDGNEIGRASYPSAGPDVSYKYQFGTGYAVGWPGNGSLYSWFGFTGLIDEPTMYNRPLTSAEVKAIYAAGSAGKIHITVKSFNPTCAGNNGAVFANVLGVGVPYNFVLTHAGATIGFSRDDGVFIDQTKGNYDLTVEDAQGHVFTRQVTLNDPAPPSATVSGGGVIRPGQSATVNVALAGGTAPYTVTLNNNGDTRTGNSPLSFTIGPQATTTYTIAAATDASGCAATLSGSAIITVDGTPPTITCPANQSGVIAGTSGPVTYPAPTVSDNLPGATVSCTPASGATFALGATTVNCTARDAVGNTAACSFTVTARQPRPASKDLIARVRQLAPGTLTTAQANGLIGHLEMANTNLERGQNSQACTHLQNFVNQVNTFVSGGQLTAAQGASLTSYANQIRNAVGCAGSPFPT